MILSQHEMNLRCVAFNSARFISVNDEMHKEHPFMMHCEDPQYVSDVAEFITLALQNHVYLRVYYYYMYIGGDTNTYTAGFIARRQSGTFDMGVRVSPSMNLLKESYESLLTSDLSESELRAAFASPHDPLTVVKNIMLTYVDERNIAIRTSIEDGLKDIFDL